MKLFLISCFIDLGLPQFVETLPAKINAIVGQNLELHCYVTSEDRLDVAYIWTHNGLKLHTVVQLYSAIVSNFSFFIFHLLLNKTVKIIVTKN